MTYLFAFFTLYLLTGATFVAYDFKVFQRVIFYIRIIFNPGWTFFNSNINKYFPSAMNAPGYVMSRNYGFALLSIIIWPLFPRILMPWFYLWRWPKDFFFNFYLVPVFIFFVLYILAIQSLVAYEKIWQITLILIIFIGTVWWLCRRRDKKIEQLRERRS
jgi:hypothetical protein